MGCMSCRNELRNTDKRRRALTLELVRHCCQGPQT